MQAARRLLLASIFAASAVSATAVTASVGTAPPCPKGSVAAVIAGKHVCLRAGVACARARDAQYRRYGFACSTGTLARPWKIRDLGIVGAFGARINDGDQIAGSAGNGRPFLWQSGKLRWLGSGVGRANALNDAGQVVGVTRVAGGAGHAFLWENGRLNDLGTLGGDESAAVAVNGRGQAVGTSKTSAGATHAVLWQNGVTTDLGTLGGAESAATAINDRGEIVGFGDTANGEIHGFLWRNGTVTDLGDGACPDAINERTQIIGGNCDDGAGFFWESGKLTYLPYFPGQTWGNAVAALNDGGQIVGGAVAGVAANQEDDINHAYLFDGGRMVDLGRLTGDNSFAVAINERGLITGWAEIAPPRKVGLGEEPWFRHAFAWQSGKITDLGTLGGYNSEALAVNDRGTVVGWSETANGSIHLTLWTPRAG